VIAQLESNCAQMCRERMRHGCPINNLAQEMSPLDEGFRERVAAIYRRWQQTLERALERAREFGQMRPEADPAVIAAMIVATTQGAVGMAKNSLDETVFRQALAGLLAYLRSLKRAD
jgi:TetR/AcrR family transcriptional repressor of nem operon